MSAPRLRGFTLLEVMISLAILAVSLVAISGLNGGAVAMEAYSRRATEATLLLRAKMNDLEDQLHKDGFSDFDDDKRGTFEDEGAPDFAWRAEILKPDVQIDPAQLLGMLGVGQPKQPDGSAGSNQLTQGLNAAAGMLGGMAAGSEAATRRLASRHRGSGPQGGGDAYDFSAQCADACSGVSPGPLSNQAAAGRRSPAIHALPAHGDAKVCSQPSRYRSLVHS